MVSASRGFRAPHMTDLGTLGLTGSGFEVAAPDVAGLNGTVGTTADATAVSTGEPVEQVGPETSLQYEGSVRYRRRELPHRVHGVRQQHLRQHPEAGADPAAGRRRHVARRHADHVAERQRRRVRRRRPPSRCWSAPTSTTRASGASSTAPSCSSADAERCAPPSPICARRTSTPTCRRTSKAARRRRSAGCRRGGRRPAARGGSSRTRHFGWEQTHLSSLDLGDRRTGAGRSRATSGRSSCNGATTAAGSPPAPTASSATPTTC